MASENVQAALIWLYVLMIAAIISLFISAHMVEWGTYIDQNGDSQTVQPYYLTCTSKAGSCGAVLLSMKVELLVSFALVVTCAFFQWTRRLSVEVTSLMVSTTLFLAVALESVVWYQATIVSGLLSAEINVSGQTDPVDYPLTSDLYTTTGMKLFFYGIVPLTIASLFGYNIAIWVANASPVEIENYKQLSPLSKAIEITKQSVFGNMRKRKHILNEAYEMKTSKTTTTPTVMTE